MESILVLGFEVQNQFVPVWTFVDPLTDLYAFPVHLNRVELLTSISLLGASLLITVRLHICKTQFSNEMITINY